MQVLTVSVWLALLASMLQHHVHADPVVVDWTRNITYHGISVNSVDKFLNIPYGKDTSGAKRFAPPEPFDPVSNTVYDATATGPVCPQPTEVIFPRGYSITNISEDCLKLNVARPSSACSSSKLPVMVYIYGGGLFNGQINDPTTAPDGLILQSVKNGLPIIHVAMNYRLNIFGFAESEALRAKNSLNVGLRDQRLALEWVKNNIEYFGGDPNKVTIFGQSSGALSVTMQVMAYGGSRGAPFHQAICESTALEAGSTSNITTDTWIQVTKLSGCNSSDPQSESTLECMRSIPFETLLKTTIAQHDSTSTQNNGDTYLPAIDGDFLPMASSKLAEEGLFSPMPVIVGWTEEDATLFTPSSIKTPEDSAAFINLYFPGLNSTSISKLLSLYPTSDFAGNPSANLSAEFYRSAQINRDIIFSCPSFYFSYAMSKKGENVYLYSHNQTILGPYLASVGLPGLGVIHTSELAYVFANLSVYDTGITYQPTPADFELMRQMSRSWSSFASVGNPSLEDHETLKGWTPAYAQSDTEFDARIYVVGGPGEGMSALQGQGAKEAIARQKLVQRCAFLNSDDVIAQLRY